MYLITGTPKIFDKNICMPIPILKNMTHSLAH